MKTGTAEDLAEIVKTNTFSEEELSRTLHRIVLCGMWSVNKVRHLLAAGASVLYKYTLDKDEQERNEAEQDGEEMDDVEQGGENRNNTEQDGEKRNNTEQDGEKRNDTEQDGEKRNDTEQDGEKRNDTEQDGEKRNDTEQDGEKRNDTEPDGEKRNDTEQDTEKRNNTEPSGCSQKFVNRNVLQNAIAMKAPLEIVRFIIESCVDNGTMKQLLSSTAYIAIETGQENIVAELFKCQLSLHAGCFKHHERKSHYRYYGHFLTKIIEENMLEVVDVLVKHNSYSDEFKDRCLLNAVRGTVCQGDIHKTKQVLEKVRNINIAVEDTGEIPLLSLAVQNGSADMVKMLVEEFGSEINIKYYIVNVNANYMRTYRTPLGDAAVIGNFDIIDFLIRNGANLNGHTRFDGDQHDQRKCIPPLFLAVEANQLDVVSMFLYEGAELTMMIWSTCMWMVTDQHYEILSLLQKAAGTQASLCLPYFLSSECPLNLDINESPSAFGTPLTRACACADVTNVHFLLEHGADPNKLDSKGASPLLCTVWLFDAKHVKYLDLDYEKVWDIVTMLVRYGADINYGCDYSWTRSGLGMLYPMDYAASLGVVQLAYILWEAGCRQGQFSTSVLRRRCMPFWYSDLPIFNIRREKKPASWCMQTEVYSFIQNVVNQPRSLVSFCRLTIRQTLGRHPHIAVRQLPGPESIRNYLDFADLDNKYKRLFLFDWLFLKALSKGGIMG